MFATLEYRLKNFGVSNAGPYLTSLADWVEKSEKSMYVMSEERLREKLAVNNPDMALAAAEFGLAEHLYKSGHLTDAVSHFKEAQRLNPKSWNYKRQAYALSDAKRDYGTTFADEVEKAGGSKAYYPPPDLPSGKDPKDKSP